MIETMNSISFFLYLWSIGKDNILDFRFTAAVQEAGQNMEANRNQILVRDKTVLNAAAGRSAGLTVNITTTTEE